MSRDTSLLLKEAVASQETGEVFLLLLTINHNTLSEPIRLVSDTKDVVSRGNTYIAYPMGIILPDDTDSGGPQVSIVIDNVDRSIIQTVRTLTTPPSVSIEVVLASTPDVVEAAFYNFIFRNITANALTVSGTLSIDNFSGEPFPGDTLTPGKFPGLF